MSFEDGESEECGDHILKFHSQAIGSKKGIDGVVSMRWIGLMTVAVAGCAELSLPGLGSSRPLGQMSAALDTSIPEGIYFGELTCRTRSWNNDELFQDDTETLPYHEVVNSNGLPLIQPGGEIPVDGLVLLDSTPPFDHTFTIKSMSTFGNRLVIEFSRSYSLDELTVSGNGTWLYEFVPPDTLSFIERFSGASEVTANGNILFQRADCSSTLGR